MRVTARKAYSAKVEWVCDGVYELFHREVWNAAVPWEWIRGACDAGSTSVESSHHPSNPILDGKLWALNKNDDVEVRIVVAQIF